MTRQLGYMGKVSGGGFLVFLSFVFNGFRAKLSIPDRTGQQHLNGRWPGVDNHMHSCVF